MEKSIDAAQYLRMSTDCQEYSLEFQKAANAAFWLVLTPAPDGGYVVRTGNLTSRAYKLAATCG